VSTAPRASRPWDGGRRAAGFSMVELLVAVAVVAVLVSVMAPSLSKARSDARRTVCLTNLHYLGLAAGMYLDDHNGAFWPYYTDTALGRVWWFGFEPGGPGTGPSRPLRRAQGLLTPYLGTADDGLDCPMFPFGDARVFPKFAGRSTSYGYNLHLSGALTGDVARRVEYLGREARVFTLADGAHFDFGDQMNEPAYIQYQPPLASGTLRPGGYAHFRHDGRAAVLMMDGSTELRRLRGPAYRVECGGPAGNLLDDGEGPSPYGIE